jgi:hypothetical protein
VKDCRLVLPGEGIYSVEMINPRNGEKTTLPDCCAKDNDTWQYPKGLNENWVFILKAKE